MKSLCYMTALTLLLIAEPALLFSPQKDEILTEAEEDKLREEQDPAARIEIYLDFLQARLDRFEAFRTKAADPIYDTGAYLDGLLGQYIALNDELKNWIEHQYQRDGDMRGGLHKLLERGPQQLAVLRQVQQSPDAYASQYSSSLRDAIDQLADTLDGATQALRDQEKKLGQLKREEKAAPRLAKERAKEEARRSKEEQKVRKRERKRRVPGELDED